MIFMTRTPRFTVNGDEKIRFFYMSVFCPRAVGEEIARAPNDVRGLLSPPPACGGGQQMRNIRLTKRIVENTTTFKWLEIIYNIIG